MKGMSQDFLNKLEDYLNERLKNGVIVLDFKPFEIDVPKASYGRRWLCGRSVALGSGESTAIFHRYSARALR